MNKVKTSVLGSKTNVKARHRHIVGAKLAPPSKQPKVGELLIKKPGNPSHGGSRPGAGRKPGATLASSTLARDILEGKRIIKEAGEELPDDCAPLDVMLMAMRSAYKLGGSLMAFPYAEKTAPYLHARLANFELTAPKGNGTLVFAWSDGEVKAPQSGEVIEMDRHFRKIENGSSNDR